MDRCNFFFASTLMPFDPKPNGMNYETKKIGGMIKFRRTKLFVGDERPKMMQTIRINHFNRLKRLGVVKIKNFVILFRGNKIENWCLYIETKSRSRFFRIKRFAGDKQHSVFSQYFQHKSRCPLFDNFHLFSHAKQVRQTHADWIDFSKFRQNSESDAIIDE